MLKELRIELPEGCASDLVLDEWKAGELEAEGAAEVGRHVATCPRCTRRNGEIDAAAAAFREGAPRLSPAFRPAPPASRAAAHGKGRRLARIAGACAASLAFAAGAALLVRHELYTGGTRSKGSGVHVAFFVKRSDRVFEGRSDERLHPRDQVRFVVSTDRPRYVAILSLDGAGVASVYYPTSGAPASLQPGRDLALEDGIELDGVSGEERIYALFCEDPIDVARERASLLATKVVAPREGCSVDTLHWTKEP